MPRRWRLAMRRTQHQTADMNQRASENTRTEDDEQYARECVPARQRRPKNEELALKQTERRHSDDGQNRHQKNSSRQRHGLDHAAFDLAEQVGFEMLGNVTGAHEQQSLGHGVKQHVQHEPH